MGGVFPHLFPYLPEMTGFPFLGLSEDGIDTVPPARILLVLSFAFATSPSYNVITIW